MDNIKLIIKKNQQIISEERLSFSSDQFKESAYNYKESYILNNY